MMVLTMNSSFIMQRSSLLVYNYNHTKPISLLPFKFQFHHSLSHSHTKSKSERTLLNLHHQNPNSNSKKMVVQCAFSSSVSEAVKKALIRSSSLTWESAILSNMLIFVLGLPILLSGLSLSGIASAFLLGTLTWRAFGPSAFLLVATYFIIVSKPHFKSCFFSSLILWKLHSKKIKKKRLIGCVQ